MGLSPASNSSFFSYSMEEEMFGFFISGKNKFSSYSSCIAWFDLYTFMSMHKCVPKRMLCGVMVSSIVGHTPVQCLEHYKTFL